MPIKSACVCNRKLSWSLHWSGKGNGTLLVLTYLHTHITVTHATIDSQLFELVAGILFHGVQDGLCLEARSLECGPGNMSLLCVRREAEYSSLCGIDPVWCKQAAERCDEDDAAIIRHGLRQRGNPVGFVREAEVVHQELHRGACDCNGAFERVHGLEVGHAESVPG